MDTQQFISAIARYKQRTGNELLRPKAALIDMDGTLYDSMPNHAAAWLKMATDEGIDATYDEFFLYEGAVGSRTINLLIQRQYGRPATEDEIARLYKIKSDNFRHLPAVEIMPGAPSVLEQFRIAGLKRILVTGSGQNSLLSRLDSDFPQAFRPELRITAANTKRGKPHPDPYLNAMQLAMAEPWQCIVLENAPLGVQSASASGAFTIAVATGPIPKEALWDSGADIVFDSMPQCAESISDLLYTMYNS